MFSLIFLVGVGGNVKKTCAYLHMRVGVGANIREKKMFSLIFPPTPTIIPSYESEGEGGVNFKWGEIFEKN
jgi:hypothetical protein